MNGEKKWKRVQVNPDDHIRVPKFPNGLSVNEYDQCLTNYLSDLAMEQLPEDRPLWENSYNKISNKQFSCKSHIKNSSFSWRWLFFYGNSSFMSSKAG